jgi:hypothetical protein
MGQGWRDKLAANGVLLTGGAFLLFGAIGVLHDAPFELRGVRTLATTIDHTGPAGSRGDRAIVEYRAAGRQWTMESFRGAGLYHMGDQEWVRYLPSAPGDGWEEVYLQVHMLFGGIGVALLAGTVVMKWLDQRQ